MTQSSDGIYEFTLVPKADTSFNFYLEYVKKRKKTKKNRNGNRKRKREGLCFCFLTFFIETEDREIKEINLEKRKKKITTKKRALSPLTKPKKI